jgi:hypothetical protein
MINELPSIFEVVTGAAKKQVKEKSSVLNNSGSKSKSNSKAVNNIFFLLKPMHDKYIYFLYICLCYGEEL